MISFRTTLYATIVAMTWLGATGCLSTLDVPGQTPQDRQWFDFVIPSILPDESPVNMGKRVLDAPAGKYGFVQVRDHHFCFENGDRAKFWGVNILGTTAFPSHEDAKVMADRIAFFGFNAVRFHNLDATFEPRGIFAGNASGRHRTAGNTLHLSVVQLDRLDYFICQLKQRGIYTNINLLVSRKFTETDGVRNAEELRDSTRKAGKPASLFDPTMIALQKDYAKKLLDRFNPYTKTYYRDEPALIMLEFTNENSLFPYWRQGLLNRNDPGILYKNNPLPDHYLTLLDTQWNKWLEHKYGNVQRVARQWIPENPVPSQELLRNPHRLSSWTFQVHEENPDLPIPDAGIRAMDRNHDGRPDAFRVHIKRSSEDPWRIQLRQENLPFDSSKMHRLTFEAKSASSGKGPMRVSVEKVRGSSIRAIYHRKVTLLNTYRKYSFVLPKENTSRQISGKASGNYRLKISLGNHGAGSIYIKNISFSTFTPHGALKTEIKDNTFRFLRPSFTDRRLYTDARLHDLYHFFIQTELAYYNEMKTYVKEELGIRALLSGNSNYYSLAGIKVQTVGDFINDHGYWDSRPDRNPSRITKRSIFETLSPGMRNLSENPLLRFTASRVHGVPYVVSEWNHAYPNPYAYELPMMMAVYGSFFDWDGAFIFALRKDMTAIPETSFIDDLLYIYQDPLKMSLCGLGSLIYMNGMVDASERTITLPFTDENAYENLHHHGITRTYGERYEAMDPLTLLRHTFDLEFSSHPSPHIPHYDNRNVIVSDTSELQWFLSRKILTINSDRVQGISGFLGSRSEKIDLNILSVQPETPSVKGNVVLLSLDDNSLSASKEMLLYAAGEVKNTDSGWHRGGNGESLYRWGRWPPLFEKMDIVVSIKTSRKDLAVVSLAPNGLISRRVDSTHTDGHLRFVFPEDTIWCLISDRENVANTDH